MIQPVKAYGICYGENKNIFIFASEKLCNDLFELDIICQLNYDSFIDEGYMGEESNEMFEVHPTLAFEKSIFFSIEEFRTYYSI